MNVSINERIAGIIGTLVIERETLAARNAELAEQLNRVQANDKGSAEIAKEPT